MIVAAALAAPGTEREAWPALPLEQPVVAPRGWWLAEAAGVHTDAGDGARGSLRYGVAHGLEVSLAGGVLGGVAAPVSGARIALARAEAPSASLALVGALTPPWSGDPGGAVGGFAFAFATSPARWSAEVLAGWQGEAAARARGELLLQLGPVAPSVAVAGALGGGPVGSLGLQVNLTRGLAPWMDLWRGDGGRGGAAGLRVAL